MAEKEIVLDVRNLKQYFHNGVGKNKVVVKAVMMSASRLPRDRPSDL